MTTSTSVQRSITTTDTRIGPPDAVRTDRSISAAWQRVTGAPISDAVLEWPPNLFALTDVVLHRSEAYRFALSRKASRPVRPPDWSSAVVAAGVEWSAVVGGDDRIPDAPVLNVKELTILTSWAEALAEVVFAGSERLETCLGDAFAGAPWRIELGVPEPSPRLRAAIAEIGNAARRATAADVLPTMSALVAEVEQNGDGVAALSPRALQSRIAARAAGTVGR